MLEIREVSKTYDGRAVVDRVTADVAAGEIFAMLGPNGAGKTTLIRMITDILRPDSGTIRIGGLAPGDVGPAEIGYLPEERGLYKRSKVSEVLAYWGQLKGIEAREAKVRAMKLIERIELAEWADKPVQALSKGMQQKVQLATALIGDPKLLILDEPFTGLDPVNTQMFEQILFERRAAGTTVILSTHQMNKVEELCDRALMIHRGRVVLYGSVRDLRRRFAEHAILIHADAPVPAVPGVRSVLAQDGGYKLSLEQGATPHEVLRELLNRGVAPDSFQLASLPLEDIFIKVVRDDLGEDTPVPEMAGSR
jgi:ABC-2 type transport system ATP-binding protein